jgi:hypothetical protein
LLQASCRKIAANRRQPANAAASRPFDDMYALNYW